MISQFHNLIKYYQSTKIAKLNKYLPPPPSPSPKFSKIDETFNVAP